MLLSVPTNECLLSLNDNSARVLFRSIISIECSVLIFFTMEAEVRFLRGIKELCFYKILEGEFYLEEFLKLYILQGATANRAL